jgi:hypothetical protein
MPDPLPVRTDPLFDHCECQLFPSWVCKRCTDFRANRISAIGLALTRFDPLSDHCLTHYISLADYQYGPAPGAAYPPQEDGYGYEAYPEAAPLPSNDLPQEMTQADKDKGAASVFRRDDASLRQRDRDEREKDPGFVSDTYAECYPGYGVSREGTVKSSGLLSAFGFGALFSIDLEQGDGDWCSGVEHGEAT